VFDDYRPFHDKHVARRTKDNAVVAEVEELRDLGKPDDSLFTIGTATSSRNWLRTVLVPGTVYRKLAITAPEIHWPDVSNPPDNGTVLVNIVADRTGHVREAVSYVSANNELRDFATQQLKGWEFKPYLVDGTPQQVETTLALDFKAQLKADPSKLPTAQSYFDRARKINDLRLESQQAFHLRATFESNGNVEQTGSGTYEETWISPTQWRREVTLKGQSVIETANGGTRYRKFKGSYASRRCDDVLDIMSLGFPGDNGDSYQDADWHTAPAQLGTASLIRVSRGYINDQGKPDLLTMIYYFDPGNGLLRADYYTGLITVYNNFQPFQGKQVARQISTEDSVLKIFDLRIDVLEAAQRVPADAFTLEGGWQWSADGEASNAALLPPKILKQVNPGYPEDAKARNIHQKVLCEVTIDKHGHVRGVRFLADADPSLERAVTNAVLEWEYSPATLKGRPIAFPVRRAFEF
jgi:TonB family protein